MSLALDVAVAVTGAMVFPGPRSPREIDVVTDSRSLKAGQTFLALRGEKYDGHHYVAEAIVNGASAVIVDNPAARPAEATTLVVENTLKAYMALAGATRAAFTGTVLAITGSAGKTTTKNFTAQMLAKHFQDRVAASPANENNEIGVSKLLLSLSNERHDVAVIEMGARHYDDISKLVAIAKPEIGILTNVGDAHLEIMGSRTRLEEAKWQLFSTGARAILNARDAASISRAPSLPESPHWFCAVEPDGSVPTSGRVTALMGTSRLLDVNGASDRTQAVNVRVPGKHNRENLAAAAAAALDLGVSLADLAEIIPNLELPRGRYERIPLASGVMLIFDAYNANAAGMVAALDAFTHEQAQRRVALLGSMAELGAEAAELHARVGRHVASTNVDVMLVGGEFAAELAMGATTAGFPSERIVPFVTNAQAARWVRENTRSGDAVLVKGSRKYHLEEIVKELQS